MALLLAEMQSFLQNRTAEDEYIQQQIQETFKELSKYHDDIGDGIIKHLLCFACAG